MTGSRFRCPLAVLAPMVRFAPLAIPAALAILAPVVILAPGAVGAQTVISCPAPAGIVGDLEHPSAAVRYLADDLLEGRLSGAPGERCAAEYIALEFRRIGLAPGGQGGEYLQPVELRTAMNPHAPLGVGMNVVGILEGSHPDLRTEAVVLGAHHDHLGRGELFGSLAGAGDPPNAIHNGADDNASGVGVLLAVAEALARGERPARTVVFVTFSGEEFGLLGSAQYVQAPSVPVENTVAMINLDMVGRLEDDPLIVNGTGTAEEWTALLDSLETAHAIPLARSPEGFGPSDHTSFYARGIPVLHFFTNVHGEYHRPDDQWERVDLVGMERITGLVTDVIRSVGDRPVAITYLAGAGTPQGTGDTGYDSWLGTIPDFAPVDYGVRLSGVSGGSPAEAVGMRSGDVLIRLGPFEITDLYALTDALRELEPGTEAEAVYVREGEEFTVSVVLGRR